MTPRQDRGDAKGAIQQGRRLLRTGTPGEILEFTRRTVARFPEDPEVQLLHAWALVGSSPEDARWHAARAVQLDIKDPGYLTRAAGLMIHVGDLTSAAAYARQAARLAPPDFVFAPELNDVTGVIAALTGDDATAERLLLAAHEAEPHREDFACHLAVFMDTHGRSAEALAILDVAISQGGDAARLQAFRDEISERVG